MSNIQIVKLTTGEDLIGDVTESEIDGRGFLAVSYTHLTLPTICSV